MRNVFKNENTVPLAALGMGLVVALVLGFNREPERPPHRDPPASEWPMLAQGPICTQINGNRRRYWHPFPGYQCDVRDAPEWPPGDFAFVIDYLLPGEVISSDRHFVLVEESDKIVERKGF